MTFTVAQHPLLLVLQLPVLLAVAGSGLLLLSLTAPASKRWECRSMAAGGLGFLSLSAASILIAIDGYLGLLVPVTALVGGESAALLWLVLVYLGGFMSLIGVGLLSSAFGCPE